jgi:lipooligosaccharide transport system permease protein
MTTTSPPPATAAADPGVRRVAPLLRILPLHLYAGRSRVLIERSFRVYQTTWWVVLSGFFEPLFYLLAMGNGLGGLVGTIDGPHGPIGYAAFIAPGLLATSAMNGAIYDSTMNVFFKMRFAKLYDGMLATSLGPMDVALGEIGWSLLRGALYATAFELTMLGMGLIESWWALLVVPCALLIAGGFAAVGMAVTTFMKTFQHLEWVQVVLLPMFLFSTTFYPLSVYPSGVQALVQCFPLYHGIEMMRGLVLGDVGWSLFGHAAYFAVMIVAGLSVTARRLERLLLR